jgi:uncharacterized membrane protein YphA (DoxX/SURF4 family)
MFKSIIIVLSRLILGVLFIKSGLGKFEALANVTDYFASLGLPLANLVAPMIASIEVVAGLFLILGIQTRWSAALLAMIMVGALITARREDITDFSSLTDTVEFLYLLLLLGLIGEKPTCGMMDLVRHCKTQNPTCPQVGGC